MTSDWAITAEHLGKSYQIRHQTGSSYVALRDVLADGVRRAGQRLVHPQGGSSSGNSNPSREEFWALRDVSFTVQPGERMGIIGRNGAGKSTLLKVLSRITDPSAGRLGIRGRVASLLEVGTGFHPELTGRENIYLNGAVLGMTRAEIKRKFDEMVDFAEVEKFLDTPVKRYSSGMYVRLAFAVAAHLEPEILIVDEVLAVGDSSFQKKCLNKMEDVGREGRTVIFVSHDMGSITRLCERAILLDHGHVLADGSAHEVAHTYLQGGQESAGTRIWSDPRTAPGDHIVRLRATTVRSEDGRATQTVDIRTAVGLEMEYEVLEPGHILVPNFHVYTEQGICAFIVHDFGSEWRRKPRPSGRFKSTVWIPGNFLAEGGLNVTAAMGTYDPFMAHFHEPDVLTFFVADNLDGNSARGDYAGPLPGVVRPIFDWETEYADELSMAIEESRISVTPTSRT
jgi:lipopolysaccharide transport system ATP-binding protein